MLEQNDLLAMDNWYIGCLIDADQFVDWVI